MDLIEECKTGLPLLRIEAFLSATSVRWNLVHLNPRSIYQCVENCNHVCEVAVGPLRLPVRGIGGKDIADGNEKLTLAILFQLMRAHVLRLLEQLDAVGERREERILEWANGRISGVPGSTSTIGTFSDPALRSGTFLLRLLHSIAPESVAQDQILEGSTQQERKLNAVYAISCAHKMGCTVFSTWEDLVEVNPKMIMMVLAAAMAEDVRRQRGSPALAYGEATAPALPLMAPSPTASGALRRPIESRQPMQISRRSQRRSAASIEKPSLNLPTFLPEVETATLQRSVPALPAPPPPEDQSMGGDILHRLVRQRRSSASLLVDGFESSGTRPSVSPSLSSSSPGKSPKVSFAGESPFSGKSPAVSFSGPSPTASVSGVSDAGRTISFAGSESSTPVRMMRSLSRVSSRVGKEGSEQSARASRVLSKRQSQQGPQGIARTNSLFSCEL